MVDSKDYLLKRCRQARQRLEMMGNIERQVRALLEEADRKREESPENKERWDAIIDRLETALYEAKSRASASEYEYIRQRKRALAAGLSEAELDASSDEKEDTSEDEWHSDAYDDAIDMASELLDTERKKSSEEGKDTGKLSLFSKISSEKRQNKTVSSENRVGISIEDRMRQRQIRVIVDKLMSHRFDSLTLKEIHIICTESDLLVKQEENSDIRRKIKERRVEFLTLLHQRMTVWETIAFSKHDKERN